MMNDDDDDFDINMIMVNIVMGTDNDNGAATHAAVIDSTSARILIGFKLSNSIGQLSVQVMWRSTLYT